MNPVAAEIYQVFRSAGMTAAQAVGVLANIQVESNFNPRAVGDHGQAHGLCQWHGDRRLSILKGCAINVTTASAVDQARALVWELENEQPQALRAVQRATSPEQAAAAFCQFYERPGDLRGQMATRERVARQLWAEFA